MTNYEEPVAESEPEALGYKMVPIPFHTRIIKLTLPLLIAVPIAVVRILEWVDKGNPGENLTIAALVLAAGGWGAWKLYLPEEREVPSYAIEVIPLRRRMVLVGWTSAGFLLLAVLIWTIQWLGGSLRKEWNSVILLFFIHLPICFVILMRSKVETLTAAAQAEEQRMRLEEERGQLESNTRWEEVMNRWYARYPMAVLCIVGAVWISNQKPGQWWWPLGLVIWAIYFAREFAIFVLILGGAYLVWQGVASLPVSVAVVIGAIIIASAMRR